MCISLRLKSNMMLETYFFKQTDLCAKAQLNATVCLFADIISHRRWHILLGPFRVYAKHQKLVFNFKVFEISKLMFTYGGIRALTIANLTSSAYGLYSHL